MYKLTLGSVNEIKASNTPQHGLFSGTIETDRVILVEDDGFPLDGNGQVAIDDASGVEFGLSWGKCHIPTYRATDSATIGFLSGAWAEKYDWTISVVPVYIYTDIMVPQSAFASVDAFIEYLVDNGIIEIQGYENPDYKLNTVSVKSAGAGYTENVVVQVPGSDGDTLGTITCTVDTDSTSATYKQVTAAAITTVGKYKSLVASQVIEVPGGTTAATLTVTMTEIE